MDQQVLTSLDERSVLGTPADATSIMCYQLPDSITFDGRPITGGHDIDVTDAMFAGAIYPKFSTPHNATPAHQDDWDPSLDVDLHDILRDVRA